VDKFRVVFKPSEKIKRVGVVLLFVEVTKHIHLRESCGVGSDGGGGSGGSNGGGFMKPMVRLEIGGDWGYTYAGKGPTYTHWRQFGAQISDASSECSNIWVECLASKHKSICAADRF